MACDDTPAKRDGDEPITVQPEESMVVDSSLDLGEDLPKGKIFHHRRECDMNSTYALSRHPRDIMQRRLGRPIGCHHNARGSRWAE